MDMMKSVCVIATLAAAISTSAVAKDLKQDQKITGPAVTNSATQMNDADLDKVTAGVGQGITTACDAGGTCSFNGPYSAGPVYPGYGRETAAGAGRTPF
jgi:opacity protein-like surface antigen